MFSCNVSILKPEPSWKDARLIGRWGRSLMYHIQWYHTLSRNYVYLKLQFLMLFVAQQEKPIFQDSHICLVRTSFTPFLSSPLSQQTFLADCSSLISLPRTFLPLYITILNTLGLSLITYVRHYVKNVSMTSRHYFSTNKSTAGKRLALLHLITTIISQHTGE